MAPVDGREHGAETTLSPGRPVPETNQLPTFLVIGAMKAGTTSLYDYLRAHPQVFMATPKELHFFPESKQWPLGVDWYAAHFADAGDALARGEVSPSYSQADQFPGVATKVAQVVPDARLVYLVREPVARLRSMYLHQVAAGREPLPIERAVRERPMYVESSRYATQLDEYRPFFPRDRILVLTTDELQRDRANALARLYAFVGVDAEFVPPNVDEVRGRSIEKRMRHPLARRLQGQGWYRAAMQRVPEGVRSYGRRVVTKPVDVDASVLTPAFEAELRGQFVPEVRRLRAFLPDDFDGWGIA
jgi:Sulfotransferase domain